MDQITPVIDTKVLQEKANEYAQKGAEETIKDFYSGYSSPYRAAIREQLENKGIDSIIKFVNRNHQIDTIIVCGKEVWGHKSGHSLFELHKNGTDQNDRIINSTSPDPYLTASKLEIKYFQDNVNLVNLINETKFELILEKSRIF